MDPFWFFFIIPVAVWIFANLVRAPEEEPRQPAAGRSLEDERHRRERREVQTRQAETRRPREQPEPRRAAPRPPETRREAKPRPQPQRAQETPSESAERMRRTLPPARPPRDESARPSLRSAAPEPPDAAAIPVFPVVDPPPVPRPTTVVSDFPHRDAEFSTPRRRSPVLDRLQTFLGDRHSLQAAILLKEILDKPLCLRERRRGF